MRSEVNIKEITMVDKRFSLLFSIFVEMKTREGKSRWNDITHSS